MPWFFSEISPGVTLEDQEYVVTSDELRRFRILCGGDDSRSESSIPPSLAAPLAQFKAASPDTWPDGTLHAEQEFFYRSPLLPDVTYQLRIRVDDKYETKGRKFVVLQTEFIGPDVLLALETRSLLLWAR